MTPKSYYRFFFIVLVDTSCWAPIIATKIFVFFSYEISGESWREFHELILISFKIPHPQPQWMIEYLNKNSTIHVDPPRRQATINIHLRFLYLQIHCFQHNYSAKFINTISYHLVHSNAPGNRPPLSGAIRCANQEIIFNTFFNDQTWNIYGVIFNSNKRRMWIFG